MSAFYDYNVTLYRDSLSTPWGFRLEGGRDFHAPLTIQRVCLHSLTNVQTMSKVHEYLFKFGFDIECEII